MNEKTGAIMGTTRTTGKCMKNTQSGKSNIVVTIVTRDLVRNVEDWRVYEESLSDHRLISVKLTERPNGIGGRNEQSEGTG
jgi:hypothetical protein